MLTVNWWDELIESLRFVERLRNYTGLRYAGLNEPECKEVEPFNSTNEELLDYSFRINFFLTISEILTFSVILLIQLSNMLVL